MRRRPASWMLSVALALLARAEVMHRQFLGVAGGEDVPCWEPPLHLVETEREIVAFVALPGIEPVAACTWFDWMIQLPWGLPEPPQLDIGEARRIPPTTHSVSRSAAIPVKPGCER